MLRYTHSSTPVPLVSKILELFVAKFIFIQITFFSRFETLSITSRLAFYLLFSIFYTYSPFGSGITPLHESPVNLFSLSLCFAAIFGHRSLFYGMDFGIGMVSHSGCFYSHFAAPCSVSCLRIITGRNMVL